MNNRRMSQKYKVRVNNREISKHKNLKLVKGVVGVILGASLVCGGVKLTSVVLDAVDKDQNDIIAIELKANSDNNTVDVVPLIDQSGDVHDVLINNNVVVTTDFINRDTNSDYIKVRAIDTTGNFVEGKISKDNVISNTKISNDDLETLYRLTTDDVNVRSTEEYLEDGSNVIGQLEIGQYVIGETSSFTDGYRWTKITYRENDELVEGYVSGQYLEEMADLSSMSNGSDIDVSLELTGIQNNVLSSYNSENGLVFGMDASYMNPTTLDAYLKGTAVLYDNLSTVNFGNVDISSIVDKSINYVYIKAGASFYGNDSLFNGAKNDISYELARVCEENNIPYGFYWYSTAINAEEAMLEKIWITNHLNDERLDNTNYNMLPYAIDVELAEEGRQMLTPKEEVTDAKIELTKLLNNDGINTIVYTEHRAIASFFDINTYLNEVNSDIWTIYPIGYTETSSHGQNSEQLGDDVSMHQIVLDGICFDGSLIDLNQMKQDAFVSYIDGTYNNDKVFSLVYTNNN